MVGEKRGFASVLLALAVSAGCAGGGAPHPPEPPLMQKADYVIGAGDELTIRVWKNPELSVVVPVRPDGKISVPLLDDVQAEGFTAIELKEVITRDLAEYVANPDVTVVVERSTKRSRQRGRERGPICSPAISSDGRISAGASAPSPTRSGEGDHRAPRARWSTGSTTTLPGRAPDRSSPATHRGAGLGYGGS
jgi:hypothetical protein